MMSNTTEKRICDRCNNFYVSLDGTRAGCDAMPVSCDYVALRLSGLAESCHLFRTLPKEKGADDEE